MIKAGNAESGRATRRRIPVPQGRGFQTELIASEGDDCPGPQAILVEQDPGWALQVHYHRVHQFQVVTAGGGSLGRHALAPFSVHYTSPESAYGPLVAGPQGLTYLTLRSPGKDGGAKFLPEERESMRDGLRKVQLTAAAPAVSDAAALSKRWQSVLETVIAPRPDGLGVWLARVAPGEALQVAGKQESGGRFIVVVAGALLLQGQQYGPVSTLFTSADADDGPLLATSSGLEALVLQFPREAAAWF